MAKSVKVHDDTHRALKALKSRRRSSSMDAVIRELIRTTTGVPVEGTEQPSKPDRLTNYVEE